MQIEQVELLLFWATLQFTVRDNATYCSLRDLRPFARILRIHRTASGNRSCFLRHTRHPRGWCLPRGNHGHADNSVDRACTKLCTIRIEHVMAKHDTDGEVTTLNMGYQYHIISLRTTYLSTVYQVDSRMHKCTKQAQTRSNQLIAARAQDSYSDGGGSTSGKWSRALSVTTLKNKLCQSCFP